MTSNFDPIGFVVRSAQDIQTLCEKLMPLCETIQLAHGKYLHWASKSGAQIWLFVDNDGQLVTIAPAFSGPSRIRVSLLKSFPRDPHNAEGGLQGWANPGEKPDGGDCAIVFDTPDFSLHGNLNLPVVRTAQITAFAHEIGIFANEDDFKARGKSSRFSSRSFIPTGLFSAAKTNEPPPAYAILTGHVLATDLRTNEISGEKFVWASVDSLGGAFDVVIPTGTLKGPLKVGEIVSGSFWLCGQLL